MEAIYLAPKAFTNIPENLTEKSGIRIGPIRNEDGLPYCRVDVDEHNPKGIQLVDDRIRFSVDLMDGLVDGKQVRPAPYRAEFTDWLWMLNLPRGTHELIRFEYTFHADPNNQSAVSLFQNYIRTHDSRGIPPGFSKVAFQLEQSRPNQIKKGSGYNRPGEIQIVNNAATAGTDKSSKRTLTDIVPERNMVLPIEIEVVYETADKGGYLKILLGDYKYEFKENTIFPDCPLAGQPKFGLYHHGLRTDDAVGTIRKKNIDAGHTKYDLDCSGITIMREGPGGKFPSWYREMAEVMTERETLRRRYLSEGYAGAIDDVNKEKDKFLTEGVERGEQETMKKLTNSLKPLVNLLLNAAKP